MLQQRDQPCDVTLMVKDGKQFKAHGNILAKASSFFERMLDCDWKESREGVIRLESLTAEIMEDILEFIYSGSVHVGSMERAEDLITAADYLFLSNLKVIAGRFLGQNLSMSNYSSIYDFAERYQCEELMTNIKKFILSNLVAIANEEHFLNLPCHEVEQLISSDDIHVSAEDDVFKIILKWINHDKNERKKNFQDLFRHVRLPLVSRHCLRKEMSKNDFVTQDKDCLCDVKYTLERMHNFPLLYPPDLSALSPRVVLQPEALVACERTDRTVWFYLPDEDLWYKLPDMSDIPDILTGSLWTPWPWTPAPQWLLSVQNKLFAADFRDDWLHFPCYDPLLNIWNTLQNLEQPRMLQFWETSPEAVFVTVVGEEICAVVQPNRQTRDSVILVKYNVVSDSWETVPSFDWGPKEAVCVVSSDKYLYSVGGCLISEPKTCLAEAARFDIIEKRWESISDIQQARHSAFGVAVGGKIYIAGGFVPVDTQTSMSQTCEMYNTSTNEWHFIASLMMPRASASMVCVEGRLYVLGGLVSSLGRAVVECYDTEKDEWRKKTVVPAKLSRGGLIKSACSLRIFKKFLSDLPSVRTEHVPRPCVHPESDVLSSSPPVEHIRKRWCSLM